MAKRRLTDRQKIRISKIQADKARRVSQREKRAEDKLKDIEGGESQTGLVIAHYGVTVDIETLTGSQKGDIVRCYKRANLPALVTGDQVIWQMGKEGEGIIVACDERRSLLQRPDIRGNIKPVAANIDTMFIVVAVSPATPANLIDRYLVAADVSRIKPVILLNKLDLVTPDCELLKWIDEYEALGYQCMKISATGGDGLNPLLKETEDKISVFVGQSAVGKSSLVNALMPDTNIKTNIVSEATGKGKHTTTTAALYHFKTGGSLIDSPGIREFGLWHIDGEQLADSYPELCNLAGQCKFRDCKHLKEPGCAVLGALETGQISQRRFDSYHGILNSLDEVEVRNDDF